MTGYQVMPRLTPDEYTDLEQSIKTDGVLVPIIVTDGGEIIDGHHRAEIARKHGIHCPEVVKHGDPAELRTFAYSLNLNRRHLTRDQRRELIAQSLRQDPQLADREHARRTGADHKTVANIREPLERRGEIPHVETRTDSLGRQQPASRPAPLEPMPESPLKTAAAKIAAELAASDDNYREQASVSAIADTAPAQRRIPAPVLSGDRLARDEGEKRSQHLGAACMTLHALTWPLPRAQYIEAWRDFPEGASPAQRDRVSPAQFRTYAAALTTLADEWEASNA